MVLGDMLRARRLQLGLTLEEVGNAVGVGKSTVRKWEQGYISNMRRDKIAALANILQIDPSILIMDSPITSQEPELEEEYLLAARSKDGKQGVCHLTKEEYQSAKAFIQTLRKNSNPDL